MNKLRTNSQRAKNAEFGLIGFAIIAFLSVVSYGFQYKLLNDASLGKVITQEAASANDLRVVIITLVYTAMYILSGVLFILWFRRAYYNQEIKIGRMESTNGWAAGAWFVPILNLFKPYQLMQEIYINAENYLVNHQLDTKNKSRYQLIGIWWFFWVALSITSIIADQILKASVESIDNMMLTTLKAMIVQFAYLLLVFVAIKVIRNYNKMELKLIAHDPEGNSTFTTENSDLLDS